jgi:hypothetical protein
MEPGEERAKVFTTFPCLTQNEFAAQSLGESGGE